MDDDHGQGVLVRNKGQYLFISFFDGDGQTCRRPQGKVYALPDEDMDD